MFEIDSVLSTIGEKKSERLIKERGGDSITSNPLIGVLDIETYYDTMKNRSFVYCFGFRTLEDKTKHKFYIEKGEDPYEFIINCVNEMLDSYYNKYTFFVHNLSGYDVVFILAVLENYNEKYKCEHGVNYYRLEQWIRDQDIIKLAISVPIKNSKKRVRIQLVDSYPLLLGSLDDLGVAFNCKTKKTKFCYEFVTENTLYYIGDTPERKYWKESNSVNMIKEEEYNLYKKPDWNLKEETLKYLDKDLDCLMEIIAKFNKYIFIEYDVQFTKCLTIARLSLNILIKKYWKGGSCKLPFITQPEIFKFIKRGYGK